MLCYKKKLFFFFFFVVVFQCTIWSQTGNDTIALPDVVVKSLPIKSTIRESAAGISVITATEINSSDGIILTPILNKIPGVLMQQGALNTNRITIRGIGARSQFSTNRIKAYFEEIPLTNGEGETTIEDIDLESLESITIIKGPNTTSFGAGLGGVIHLKGKTTTQESSFGKVGTSAGSYDLLKQTVAGGYSNLSSSIYATYNQLENSGYRANSNYDRKSMNVFAKHQISKASELSLMGITTKLKAFIPSSLKESDYNDAPQIAAPTWLAAQGFESYDKLQFGIGYRNQFSDQWSFQSSLFSTYTKAYEPRPFDILAGKTANFGFRSTINNSTAVFSLPVKMCLGAELLTETYDFSLFKNLYVSQPGSGSIQGAKFNEQKQKRNYLNIFFQFEIQLSDWLKLEQGIALNTTNYAQSSLLQNHETPEDEYTFGTIWSPRLGLSCQITKGKNLYASFSKGFSIPTIAESLTPEGNINTNLLPEIGFNYEIGFKGDFFTKKLYTEVSFYHTAIKNLLVARRVDNDQSVGINAGKSLHQGVELLINLKLLEQKFTQLSAFLSGTVANFKFNEFIELDKDYIGNKLPAIPNQQWNIGFDFSTKNGWLASTSLGKIGKMYLSDANLKSSQSYTLWDAKVNYSFTLVKKLTVGLSAGIQNILNEKYASSILPNAVAFGNAQPRYFYPGNPTTYYGGVTVGYQFK